jgi:VWFA-related protein
VIKYRLPLALLYPPLALAQSLAQTPAPQQPPVITANSTVVLVPAIVTTRAGEPVYTLTATDFTLTDDGVPQQLTLEENNGDEPLALVVAIQTGGFGARQLANYGTLPLMIQNIVGDVPHKIALVSFDSAPRLAQDFTSDAAPLEAAIHALTPGNGGAAILDTLGYAIDLLKDQPIQYRRAVLLLSETLDRGSHLKLEDALREVSDTNTAIYSLGFPTAKSEAAERSGHAFANHTPGPRHGCMARDTAPKSGDSESPQPDATGDSSTPDTPPGDGRSAKQVANQAYDCLSLLAPPFALAKMAVIAGMNGLQKNVPETVADLTGGEYFQFKNAKTLERDLETISNHVPNRYMLTFHPQSPHVGLHAVDLRLNQYPHLDVAARSSYWVEQTPPQTQAQIPVHAQTQAEVTPPN